MTIQFLKDKEYYSDGCSIRQRARRIFGVKLSTLKALALIILFFLAIGFCGSGTFPY